MKKFITAILIIISTNAFSQKMLILPDTPRFANQNKGAWVLRLVDTSAWYSNGTRWVRSLNTNDLTGINFDSTSISDRINLKLNISDTANMLTNYFRSINIGYGLFGNGKVVTPLYVDSSSVNGLVSKTRLNNSLNTKQNTISSLKVNKLDILNSNRINLYYDYVKDMNLVADINFKKDTSQIRRFSQTIPNLSVSIQLDSGLMVRNSGNIFGSTTNFTNSSSSAPSNYRNNVLIDTLLSPTNSTAGISNYESIITIRPIKKNDTAIVFGNGFSSYNWSEGYNYNTVVQHPLVILTNDSTTSGLQNWFNSSGNGTSVKWTFKKFGFGWNVGDEIELYHFVSKEFTQYMRLSNLTTGRFIDTFIEGNHYSNSSPDWHRLNAVGRFTLFTTTGNYNIEKYKISTGNQTSHENLIIGNSYIEGWGMNDKGKLIDYILKDSGILESTSRYASYGTGNRDIINCMQDIRTNYKPKRVILFGTSAVEILNNGMADAKETYINLVSLFKKGGVEVVHTSFPPIANITNADQNEFLLWLRNYPLFYGDSIIDLKASMENPGIPGTYASGLASDGVHPTYAGYLKIASVLKNSLPNMFKNTNKTPLVSYQQMGSLNSFHIPESNTIATFGAGGGNDADTTSFNTTTIYGSFFNNGTDSLVITRFQAVLQGSSPSITYKVFYNDSLNVEAGATALVTAGTAVNNIYAGSKVEVFDNNKIPPNVWVWVKTSTVTTKPTYFSLSLIGYRKKL